MGNDAEIEGLDEAGEELNFAESDSLPWLESDEEDEGAGGFDSSQLIGLAAILLVFAAIFVGIVYFLSSYNRGPVEIADGSLIEAPKGPYKERPENPGGRKFAGTDAVAPEVGNGGVTDGRIADTGAGSGDQNLGVAMPPIAGGEPTAPVTPAPQPAETSAPEPSAATSGVGVQVGAFGSRARAEQGWNTLRRQSAALSGYKRRILEGQADRGTVFRLQAVAPTLAEANRLCAALKRDGLDCQVKR